MLFLLYLSFTFRTSPNHDSRLIQARPLSVLLSSPFIFSSYYLWVRAIGVLHLAMFMSGLHLLSTLLDHLSGLLRKYIIISQSTYSAHVCKNMYLSRDLHLNMDRIFLYSNKNGNYQNGPQLLLEFLSSFCLEIPCLKKFMEKKYLFDSKFQVIVPHLSEVKVADT